jgi:hypothetical protein
LFVVFVLSLVVAGVTFQNAGYDRVRFCLLFFSLCYGIVFAERTNKHNQNNQPNDDRREKQQQTHKTQNETSNKQQRMNIYKQIINNKETNEQTNEHHFFFFILAWRLGRVKLLRKTCERPDDDGM